MTLSIGTAAPDFELSDQHGNKVSLSSFKGKKNVVLLFIPFAFTGTCTGELCAMRDDLSSFAAKEGYNFPVLADFWPHGTVAQSYEIFDDVRGCALRGTFVIDKEGIIRWTVVNGLGDARSNDDYKAALAAL